MSFLARSALLMAFLATALPSCPLVAAPFRDLHVSFTQPDGTPIEVIGAGDEFYAVFETAAGYTTLFDPALKAYCFARQSAGGQLISTRVQVQRGDPAALGLQRHERMSREERQQQVRARQLVWDQGMQVGRRWEERKAAVREAAALSAGSAGEANPIELSPPSSTTTGNKTGLCLLIDFDDAPATIPQAEIINFCNADNYTGYGNFSSVKKYFQDVSNGLLIYSNVVTIYIRIPNSLHPKSYYNDTTKDCGAQANLLIRDAINIMKALPNYYTEILPTFNSLTVDSNNRVVACNVFYAGANSGVWSKGLWPHSWSLYNVGAQALSPGGKQVYRYQISNIGSSLAIGTFCHENGHMLCGYPDIYDYDYDSRGGAGGFCLMNDGNYANGGRCPVQVCAYLKRASGWATTIGVSSNSTLTATVAATAGSYFNHFYRFQKPGINTEYFLVECRYKTGHDTYLPGSGVAIWHIDELGDHDNQSPLPNTTHANYEVTLVQADNRWDLQNNMNDGDSTDLYYSGNAAGGYLNQFSDTSAPNAYWWDGTKSGATFTSFSPRATTMTFSIGTGPVIVTQPQSQSVAMGEDATFSVLAAGSGLIYQWRFNDANLGAANGSSYTRTNARPEDAGTYAVLVSNPGGSILSASATLTVNALPIIKTQPVDQTTGLGLDATFTVTATSAVPLTYQWQFDGNDIPDATNAACTLSAAQVSNTGPYRVIVANSYGSVYSTSAVLRVLDPFIASQPQNQSAAPGDTVQFSVNAVGTLPLSYQWEFNGSQLSGATESILTVESAQLEDIGTYIVTVSNSAGTALSRPATLALSNVPPLLSMQPVSQRLGAGSAAVFAVQALGIEPLGYQWSRGGVALADGGKIQGANGAVLTVSNAQAGDLGLYSAVVSNAYGFVGSSNALLTLWPVLGWGQNAYQQADIPEGLTNLVRVACGSSHSLGLKADGTVSAWGAGRTNSGINPNFGQALVPSTLAEPGSPEAGYSVAVAAGGFHSLALKADGKVVGWGAGSTNSGISPQYGQVVVPASLSNVTAIAAGAYHTLALKSDGTVVAWGAGTANTGISPHYGQAQVPAGLSDVVAIACGFYHSLALTSDGRVVAWGANVYGQTNVPSDLSNVVAIAAGNDHCLALQADGTVKAWGRNNGGQADVPAGLDRVVAIGGGLYHSIALRSDGTVAAWGWNTAGQTTIPFGLTNVMGIASGASHNLALENDGRPVITVPPVTQIATLGASARFTALAVGSPPLRYQWWLGGTSVPGGAASTLEISQVQASDLGNYFVVITNSFGAVTSTVVSLSLPTVTLDSPQFLAVEGRFHCNVLGIPGRSYVIEGSSDLANWTPLQTNVSPFLFIDNSGSPGPARFYRARQQP